MGILGRRMKPKASNSDGAELLARQLASRDPVLRRLAEEAPNSTLATVVPFPSKRATKPAETLGSKARNTCNGNHGRSVLSGEKLTCGFCDGRKPRMRHTGPSCRYCGRPAGDRIWICEKCEKIPAGFDTAGMRGHSIADRRGWIGPSTIGDDELWITILRRLRDADRRRLHLDQKDERLAKRAKRAAA